MLDTWFSHFLYIRSVVFALQLSFVPGIAAVRPRFLIASSRKKRPITFNICYSSRVFAKPVPGLGQAHSIFQQPGFFDSTFVLLIVADEASLNAKREKRLERHSSSAIINTGSQQHC